VKRVTGEVSRNLGSFKVPEKCEKEEALMEFHGDYQGFSNNLLS
jgi:hypothetical protein